LRSGVAFEPWTFLGGKNQKLWKDVSDRMKESTWICFVGDFYGFETQWIHHHEFHHRLGNMFGCFFPTTKQENLSQGATDCLDKMCRDANLLLVEVIGGLSCK